MTTTEFLKRHGQRAMITLFSFAFFLLCSCGGGGGGGSDSNSATATNDGGLKIPATYSGNMTTKIDYVNSVTGAVFESKTYSNEAVVKIGPPASIISGNATLAKESNLFNLQIWTLPFGETAPEYAAKTYICSAAKSSLTTVPIDPNTLWQFWTLALSGNKLTGAVTDAHSGNSLKPFANFVNFEPALYLVYTGPLRGWVDKDTSMSGTITANQVSIAIDGSTVAVTGPFGGYYCKIHCEITGSL